MTRLLSKERRESSVGQWGVSGYTPRRKASGLITLVMWETGLASTSPHDLISLAFLGPHCVRVKCTMWWVSTQAHIWETTTTLRMVSIPTTSESLLLSCCFLSFQGSACPPSLCAHLALPSLKDTSSGCRENRSGKLSLLLCNIGNIKKRKTVCDTDGSPKA